MNWKGIQEPSFVAAALICVLIIGLFFSQSGSSSQSKEFDSSQSKEFDEALSITESHLNKGDFESAFDMVMVASRLAPSDPRLFDSVIRFIEEAKSSKNEDAIAMAEDLLDRGDSLVHFQAPGNVKASRKRLSDLRQSFLKEVAPATPPTPLDSVKKLLTVAKNQTLPLSVRSRAVEQARAELDDIRFDAALAQAEEGAQAENMGSSQPDVLKQLADQIDNAEKQCISELFLQSKSKIKEWSDATEALLNEIDTAPAGKVPDLSKKISELVSQGYEYLQELMPYSKSKVEGAPDLSKDLEKKLNFLQRQKNWLYNQQVLRLIRDIESHKDWTSKNKIQHLAKVREELLEPYVLRRHNQLWDKVFESLPDEDHKVWAVRLRILRLNE